MSSLSETKKGEAESQCISRLVTMVTSHQNHSNQWTFSDFFKQKQEK